MEQPIHYFQSPVQIGAIKMTFKIIHYTVRHSQSKQNLFLFSLAWIDDPSKLTVIAYSLVSDFQVRIPKGIFNLMVYIRDTADCVTTYNISSINVQLDSTETNNLMNNLENTNSNPLVQLLSSGDQNTVGQVMSSLSQQFNTMNNQSVNQAVSSNDRGFSRIIKRILFLDGISAASISISSLGSQSLEQVNFI
jgi:hypothetical protein